VNNAKGEFENEEEDYNIRNGEKEEEGCREEDKEEMGI